MNMLSIGVTSSGSLGELRPPESGVVCRESGLEAEAGGGGGCSTTGRMIGAMPAVAVRHERRRQEKRQRPSILYLQSPTSRSPTPSPMHSPPAGGALTPSNHHPPPEIYLCGKVSVLHVVVVSLLLGAVLLIVGLVQLKPGADASQHRYLLLGSGSFLLLLGVVLAIVRCCVLPWATKRHRAQPHQDRPPPPTLESGISLGVSPSEADEDDEQEDDPSRKAT